MPFRLPFCNRSTSAAQEDDTSKPKTGVVERFGKVNLGDRVVYGLKLVDDPTVYNVNSAYFFFGAAHLAILQPGDQVEFFVLPFRDAPGTISRLKITDETLNAKSQAANGTTAGGAAATPRADEQS